MPRTYYQEGLTLNTTNLNQNKSHSKKFQDTWQEKWNFYRFQVIVVVCFLIWTPLLVTETLQIQHGCYPMIHFSNKLPEKCQQSPPIPKKKKKNHPNPPPIHNPSDVKPKKTKKPPNSSPPKIEPEKPICCNPPKSSTSNIQATTASIVVGSAAAFLGAPIAVVVGVGILAWLATKKFL